MHNCKACNLANSSHLVGSSRNEEPLVDTRVNWSWSKVFMGWDVWELIWGNTAWGLLDSQVGANEVVNMYLYFWKV